MSTKQYFNQETYPDWNQRYTNCFGLVHFPDDNKAEPKKVVVKFVDVTEQAVYFRTEAGGPTSYLVPESNIPIEFPMLKKKWYQTSMGPLLTIRRPARQWKRGMSRGNCSVYYVSHKGFLSAAEPSYENMRAVLLPSENYDVTGHKVLSDEFMLTKEGFLYFYEKLVGTVDHKLKKIKTTSMFIPEIFDVIKASSTLNSYTMEASYG